MGRISKREKVRAVINDRPTCPGCGSGQVYTKKCGIRVCRLCGREYVHKGGAWVQVNEDMTEQSGA